MDISPTISVGDIAVVVGMAVAATGNYFAIANKIKATDWKVEELRRGRGLILDHWPPMVRRCFGYDGQHPQRPQRPY